MQIVPSVLHQLSALSKEAAPEECCGFLGGNADKIINVYPVPNVAYNKLISYEIAPRDYMDALTLMRIRGEELLAIYHSHPNGEAEPSDNDVRLAFSDVAYIVIGQENGRTAVRGYRLREHKEELDISVFS